MICSVQCSMALRLPVSEATSVAGAHMQRVAIREYDATEKTAVPPLYEGICADFRRGMWGAGDLVQAMKRAGRAHRAVAKAVELAGCNGLLRPPRWSGAWSQLGR